MQISRLGAALHLRVLMPWEIFPSHLNAQAEAAKTPHISAWQRKEVLGCI